MPEEKMPKGSGRGSRRGVIPPAARKEVSGPIRGRLCGVGAKRGCAGVNA